MSVTKDKRVTILVERLNEDLDRLEVTLDSLATKGERHESHFPDEAMAALNARFAKYNFILDRPKEQERTDW